MKKSIGILYICTGPYTLFWEDFYKSFEDKFLPDFQKKYYIFTDSDCIYAQENKFVKVIKIEPQPWPLITLFRFSTFLKVEKDLKECDYLMFSNANMICNDIITAEEFLPRENEILSVTSHPGYYGMSKINFPYERSKKSSAYIPWNCGNNYVIGAMFCGKSDAFIKMSKTLKRNIEEDLKKNVIAKWHDESQLNRYIIDKPGIRVLKPMYCYPFGMNVSYPKKISAVSKEEKFDVKSFKGQYSTKQSSVKKILGSFKRKLLLKERILFLYDTVRQAHVGEMKDAE